MIENILYIEFSENDYHDFHAEIDTGIPFCSRKIAVNINISKSEDYRGGDLEFLTGSKPFSTKRTAGTTTLSPSYILRKTSQVTSGKKRVIIAWIS
jgi:predicted 2-oxoglutarate/Fe(II)-dependent dioxygenase YbiX